MTITFEKERKQINWTAFITIALIVILIGITIYYLFFAEMPLVNVLLSPKLKQISDFKKINNFDFSETLGNISGKNMSFIPLEMPSAEAIGKSNPFLP